MITKQKKCFNEKEFIIQNLTEKEERIKSGEVKIT